MLEAFKNSQGDIQAVCEWYSVDERGFWDTKGIYCWINELVVSKSYERKNAIPYFIETITSKYPQFLYAYFWRKRKYKDRPARIYSKRQWLKLLK